MEGTIPIDDSIDDLEREVRENRRKIEQVIQIINHARVNGDFVPDFDECLEKLHAEEIDLTIQLVKARLLIRQNSRVFQRQNRREYLNQTEQGSSTFCVCSSVPAYSILPERGLSTSPSTNSYYSIPPDEDFALSVSPETKGAAKLPNNPQTCLPDSNSYNRPDAMDNDEKERIARQWAIDRSRLHWNEADVLGTGAFGDVFLGTWNDELVAIKQLRLGRGYDRIWDTEETVRSCSEELNHEVAVMAKLRNPNILLFMGVVLAPDWLLVTEYMANGSVFSLLHEKKSDLSFLERMMFARDAAMGLNWLHTCNPVILHLDLKTQNLFVDENWTVKVADFGLAKIKQRSQAFQGAVGQKPDRDRQIPKGLDPKSTQVLMNCWHSNPDFRPTMQDLIQQNVFMEAVLEGLMSPVNDRAKKMWLRHFPSKVWVSWKDFFPVLCGHFTLLASDDFDFEKELLKQLLDVEGIKGVETVRLEHFADVCEWCGPITRPFLQDVKALMLTPGFYGNISAGRAEETLGGMGTDRRDGSYLIRFSTRTSGWYALSVLTSDEKQSFSVKHYRIQHAPGEKYRLCRENQEEYVTLADLVKANETELQLQCPLWGPYQKMLETFGTDNGKAQFNYPDAGGKSNK